MKKSLLLVAAALFATSASFAQAPAPTTHLPTHRVTRLKPVKTPEQRADKHTAKLTKQLQLSADQQSKVQQIMLAQAQEAQAIKTKYPDAAQQPARHQELQASHAKYQAQLQRVLSADQYTKLTAMQQAHQHKGHGEHGGKMNLKS